MLTCATAQSALALASTAVREQHRSLQQHTVLLNCCNAAVIVLHTCLLLSVTNELELISSAHSSSRLWRCERVSKDETDASATCILLSIPVYHTTSTAITVLSRLNLMRVRVACFSLQHIQ
jgi:hypothetical protein